MEGKGLFLVVAQGTRGHNSGLLSNEIRRLLKVILTLEEDMQAPQQVCGSQLFLGPHL